MGVDEAGRGPVLGPMIVAGIIIPEDKTKILDRIGVKDSKKLTPKRRTVLDRKLRRMFEYETVEITAKDIDTLRAKEINLNEIEKTAIIKVIEKLNPEAVVIDSLDVKPKRLEEEIKTIVKCENVKAEHKADENYLQVAAASIIAKTERDRKIEEINKKYIKLGGIGSGYPSDPKTKQFLKNFTYDEMPEFVRKSWNTIQKMK